MNPDNGLTDNQIFGGEDVLNQGLAPGLGEDNTDLGIERAYVDLITKTDGESSLLEDTIELLKQDLVIEDEFDRTPLLRQGSGSGIDEPIFFGESVAVDEVDEFTGSGASSSQAETEAIEPSSVAGEVSSDGNSASSSRVNYAVKAEGKITLKGIGDFDGEPLDLQDDARIYAGNGFTIEGVQKFPVLRDDAGAAILDDSGREILLDNAVDVGPDYSINDVSNSNQYSGLVPPNVVSPQTVEVPGYQDLKQSVLDSAIGESSQTVALDAKGTALNSEKKWLDNFPAPGTAENPTVVTVTNGDLKIPNKVDLSNYVIVVEQGDIQFNGSEHDLENVVLIAESGKMDISHVRAYNSSFLAESSIDVKNGNSFTGESLIANNSNQIKFTSHNRTIYEEDNLRVIAGGDLEFKTYSSLRGEFLSQQDIKVQGGQHRFYGSMVAKGDIDFNGQIEVFGVVDNSEITASIASVTVNEGNEANTAALNVTLSAPAGDIITIDYSTSDDSAVAGSDYTATSGTVTFNPGEISQTIEIPITGDTINEGDEAFTVQLTNPIGVILSDEQAVVNLLNDDNPPQLAIGNVELTAILFG